MNQHYRSLIEQVVRQTIQLIETEYPNGIRLTLPNPSDKIITPKGIYPAFYGCYDWHSAVHSHWQIVKAMRLLPDADFVPEATDVLNRTLTAENIAVEMEWIAERKNFEMPYGMAWLLTLAAELKDWGTGQSERWYSAIRPMETHAVDRFFAYCERLPMPQRGGLHNQTAFSLGLAWDYAKQVGNRELSDAVSAAGLRFFWTDTNINLRFEPSAADFLSPSLSEADLMGRLLPPDEFGIWLDLFAPDGFGLLRPVTVVDPSNGQLAHWAGLNLSRSWMLTHIANALPEGHPAISGLIQNGEQHRDAGLPMAAHPDYMISHWVPTFAVYLLSIEN